MEKEMKDISNIKEKIEKLREEVRECMEHEPYEVAYAKNQELDRLIEMYLDAVEESTTNHHQFPPPDTTET
jgi:tetrahydromethanopterin S-methyltransferase subunit B